MESIWNATIKNWGISSFASSEIFVIIEKAWVQNNV